MVVGTWTLKPELIKTPSAAIPAADKITNTEALGRVLYTDYIFFFQTSGIILLVAMIGAIVLTLRDREGVKRQDISKQVARNKETAMEIKKVNFREGV
jgi:NADH-quinone oxidoreductase subunit J